MTYDEAAASRPRGFEGGKAIMSKRPANVVSSAQTTATLRRTKRLKSAFSVNADDLIRLSDIVETFGTVLWSVELSDGTVMKRITLADFVALPNGVTSVKKASVAASTPNNHWHKNGGLSAGEAEIELDADPDGFYSCTIGASGDPAIVEAFFKKALDWLRDVKPVYSWFAKPALPTIVSTLVLIFTGPVLFGAGLKVLSGYGLSSQLSISLVFLATLVVSFCIFPLLERLQLLLLPRGEFAYGHGEKRQKTRMAFRWGVVAAFVVGVAASVVANVISG
jgi:hypothetical protein